MKIAGLQKNSFIDYPGKIAAVIFTPGCNLKCYYCHNYQLLAENALAGLIPEKTVISFLQEKKGLLDAVVISGGEPTLQPDLGDFIQAVKKLGYLVKLDTNGTNPDILKKLIKQSLLDYVAMDIKAPVEKYRQICGTDEYAARISASIDLLLKGAVEYEFRTTVVPELKEEDILAMAGRIKGAGKYILQQVRYRPTETGNGDPRLYQKPHSAGFFNTTAEKLRKIVTSCAVRGL